MARLLAVGRMVVVSAAGERKQWCLDLSFEPACLGRSSLLLPTPVHRQPPPGGCRWKGARKGQSEAAEPETSGAWWVVSAFEGEEFPPSVAEE